MSYTINKFNGEPLIVLQDGSIDVSTSIKLVGRNYVGYGEIQNENFIFLAENFSNPSPPARPLLGQTWFNSENKLLNVYDGSKWSVLGSAQLSDTAPESPAPGYIWFKTPEKVLYIWDGDSWNFMGPEKAQGFGETKATSRTLLDTDGVVNPVILIVVNDNVVAICSNRAFTIAQSNAVLGFTNLFPGVTLSNVTTLNGNLKGLADRATRLENIKTINGVGFDGTSNITIAANTTNSLIPGENIVGSNFNGATTQTWRVDSTSANIPGKVISRNSEGGFSAGTISANLIGDVTGNVTASTGTSRFSTIEADRFVGAILSGNADTATRLQTPRTINGVSFDGSTNITVLGNAETLTGTFLKSTVRFSNLETVGTLQNLSVLNSGINIGSANQLRVEIISNVPTIQSINEINISCDAGGPRISFIGSLSALQQGGPEAPAIVSNNSVNLGIPSKKFDQVYANNFRGLADNATSSVLANNLSGGGPGNIPYQTLTNQTAMLPPGTPGQVLTIGGANSLRWTTPSFEALVPGDYIVGQRFNTLIERQWSVDASVNTVANKVVARDANGDFSSSRITLTETPIAPNHAVTKSYIESYVETFVESFVDIRKINIISENNIITDSWSNAVNSFDDSKNFFDVFPPEGKTMENLVAFIPSISRIRFAGNVNGDDSMRCIWNKLDDRVRVYVQNTEQRDAPAANYLAIWSQ
jgi:hypothetical protein